MSVAVRVRDGVEGWVVDKCSNLLRWKYCTISTTVGITAIAAEATVSEVMVVGSMSPKSVWRTICKMAWRGVVEQRAGRLGKRAKAGRNQLRFQPTRNMKAYDSKVLERVSVLYQRRELQPDEHNAMSNTPANYTAVEEQRATSTQSTYLNKHDHVCAA